MLLLLAASANQSATAFTTPTPANAKIHQNRMMQQHITATLSARKKNTEDEESSSLSSSSSSISNNNNNPAKKAALEGVLQRIERNYGRGSIVKLGDADRMIVDVIGSGSLTLGE
jgi:FKBP-type peptidyl-prolyl cis-trans isomerase